MALLDVLESGSHNEIERGSGELIGVYTEYLH